MQAANLAFAVFASFQPWSYTAHTYVTRAVRCGFTLVCLSEIIGVLPRLPTCDMRGEPVLTVPMGLFLSDTNHQEMSTKMFCFLIR